MVPSIRLKAYRRGQQDVEYLTLWSRQCGLPRGTVGRQVREALHLSGSRQATETGGAEDAGRIDYSGLCPQDLWALRLASARPCPWLIQQPNRDSSTFALRHEIRLQVVRSRRPTQLVRRFQIRGIPNPEIKNINASIESEISGLVN